MNVLTHMVKRIVLLGCGLLACLSVLAGEMQVHEFPLGPRAALAMVIDDTWKETPPPKDTLAAISVESKAPGRLHMLLTPIPVLAGQPKSDSEVRALVQNAAQRLAPQSVEKTLTLSSIRGLEAKGYHFHATDPLPMPGEYRFMYQGVVAIGGLIVTFTVLYNDGAEEDAKAALASIQGLRLVMKAI